MRLRNLDPAMTETPFVMYQPADTVMSRGGRLQARSSFVHDVSSEACQ